MLKKFRAYQLAVEFYQISEKLICTRHLKDQILRASSGIVLNLAEGSERVTNKDRRRFYRMAMGSIRECQAILDLSPKNPTSEKAKLLADHLGASVFKLCKSIEANGKPSGPESREPRAGKRSVFP